VQTSCILPHTIIPHDITVQSVVRSTVQCTVQCSTTVRGTGSPSQLWQYTMHCEIESPLPSPSCLHLGPGTLPTASACQPDHLAGPSLPHTHSLLPFAFVGQPVVCMYHLPLLFTMACGPISESPACCIHRLATQETNILKRPKNKQSMAPPSPSGLRRRSM
jgi:hypothetical protein